MEQLLNDEVLKIPPVKDLASEKVEELEHETREHIKTLEKQIQENVKLYNEVIHSICFLQRNIDEIDLDILLKTNNKDTILEMLNGKKILHKELMSNEYNLNREIVKSRGELIKIKNIKSGKTQLS